MWGGRVGGRSFFGGGQYTGNIMQGAVALQPQDYMLDGVTPLRRCIVVTGVATIAPSAETGASVAMGQYLVVDGPAATLAPSTNSKGLILLFRRGIYARNGGHVHIDGLGKAGNFGALTPYSLIPARLRTRVAPRLHAQFVVCARGADGGPGYVVNKTYQSGAPGAAAGPMQTGGGGSGAANTYPPYTIGAGGCGGPCSGGAASGGSNQFGSTANAGDFGGPGSAGITDGRAGYTASGGAGDPPGEAPSQEGMGSPGESAGGGLLALFAPFVDIDTGCAATSSGARGGIPGGTWPTPGGSAGGGVIIVATREGGYRNEGTVSAPGGAAVQSIGTSTSGPGGVGSVNVFTVTA